MPGALIENWKIMDFLMRVDISLNISLQIRKLQSRQISKTKSIKKGNSFAYRVIYFRDKSLNRISYRNCVEKFKIYSDELGNDDQKKKLKKYLGELSDEICNSIWFGLVWFYGISTFVGYLTPNPFLYK